MSDKSTNSADLSELLHQIADEARKMFEEERNRDLRGEALVCCTIPKQLLQEFQDHVVLSYYPGGISEAVADLIHTAVLKKRPKTKHPFYDGPRHFGIPRSCFIIFTLTPSEWGKLKEWTDKHEQVYTCPAGLRAEGEVFLMNQTRLDRRHSKEAKEADESCPVS